MDQSSHLRSLGETAMDANVKDALRGAEVAREIQREIAITDAHALLPGRYAGALGIDAVEEAARALFNPKLPFFRRVGDEMDSLDPSLQTAIASVFAERFQKARTTLAAYVCSDGALGGFQLPDKDQGEILLESFIVSLQERMRARETQDDSYDAQGKRPQKSIIGEYELTPAYLDGMLQAFAVFVNEYGVELITLERASLPILENLLSAIEEYGERLPNVRDLAAKLPFRYDSGTIQEVVVVRAITLSDNGDMIGLQNLKASPFVAPFNSEIDRALSANQNLRK